MAYHHLADINGMTRLLASFLAPGGTLLVVDIVKSDESVRAAKELFEKRAKAEAEAEAQEKLEATIARVTPHLGEEKARTWVTGGAQSGLVGTPEQVIEKLKELEVRAIPISTPSTLLTALLASSRCAPFRATPM